MMSEQLKNTSYAADGKTALWVLGIGFPIMVRALDFNELYGQRNQLLEFLKEMVKLPEVRSTRLADEIEVFIEEAEKS
jgi:hypothetical protein